MKIQEYNGGLKQSPKLISIVALFVVWQVWQEKNNNIQTKCQDITKTMVCVEGNL